MNNIQNFTLIIWKEPIIITITDNIHIQYHNDTNIRSYYYWRHSNPKVRKEFIPNEDILRIAYQINLETINITQKREHLLLPILLDALVDSGCIPDEEAEEYRKPMIRRKYNDPQ